MYFGMILDKVFAVDAAISDGFRRTKFPAAMAPVSGYKIDIALA